MPALSCSHHTRASSALIQSAINSRVPMTLTITRRHLVLGGLAAAAMRSPIKPGHAQSGRKTFVLVHGSWHGGWCWRRTAALLESKDHKVYCPTLTGLGERAHLLTKDTNISMHVTDVENLIMFEDLSDIVLVGHSYGGYVISGVAETHADRISSIVFLDAFLPEDGESVLDKTSPAFREMINAAAARSDASIKAPPSAAFGVDERDRPLVEIEADATAFCDLHRKG